MTKSRVISYLYKKRWPIIGTLVFHLVLLLLLSVFTVKQRTLERPEPLIAIEFEDDFEEKPVEPEEEPPAEQQPREVRSDRAVSETAGDDVEEGSRNVIPQNNAPSKSQKQSIDEQIEQELRDLEQQVIDEQRAAGYGYTEEQARELIDSKRNPEVEKIPEKQAVSEEAVKGETNISYKLENRYDTYIKVPVYMCQNGGEVTVNIAVNKSGKVVAAKVDHQTTSTADACLLKQAESAAMSTRFNSASDAPELQRGSITFRFAAQ